MGGREKCERDDPRAQAMMFDLHNLAPSIGQVNALRSNDRYADLPAGPSNFGQCTIQDTGNAFEPPDCLKGDVARIWLYMSFRHGVVIPPAERLMFEQWSANDPVSPWEKKREGRIFDHTFVHNPQVYGVATDPKQLCKSE